MSGDPSAPTAPVVLGLDAGPDSGRVIVAAAPIVLGRAPGPGRIDDTDLEAHHLVVDPTRRTVVQLTGRIPTRIDGVPIGTGRAILDGTVIEMGASRIVVEDEVVEAGPAPGPDHTSPVPPAVVVGVGIAHDRVDPDDRGVDPDALVFAELADRRRRPSPIVLDLDAVRRVLVVGPVAERFAASLAVEAALRLGRRRVAVTGSVLELHDPDRRGRLVIAHHPDPDLDWPGHDLPVDGAVISVGSSWRATLVRLAGDGSTSVQRFHAAARARDHGRTGRSSLNR